MSQSLPRRESKTLSKATLEDVALELDTQSQARIAEIESRVRALSTQLTALAGDGTVDVHEMAIRELQAQLAALAEQRAEGSPEASST
jgi:uncharacterized coiled-coil protein SlyX